MDKQNIAIIGIIVVVIAAVALLSSDSFNQSASGEITVLAGAGFSKVMPDMVAAFEEKYPNSEVIIKYGGSGELFATMKTTHTGDVFLPADYKYMQDAMDNGFVENDTVQNLTTNIPIIAVAKGNPKNITSLEDLAKPGVKVGLGDAEKPAIGKASAKILNASNLTDNVSTNVVVYTSTVNQLLTYLISGQVDAVIIWEDMATWSDAQGKIDVVKIPENQNKISTVPVAVTSFTNNTELAQKFEEFLVSPEADAIWEKWGFKPLSS